MIMIYCLLILVKSILTLVLKMWILLLCKKNYNTVFTSPLDKHASLKIDYVVPCDLQPWMTEEIMSAGRETGKGSGSGENSG